MENVVKIEKKRKFSQYKHLIVVILIILLSGSVFSVSCQALPDAAIQMSYPMDNAALLYYKAFLLFERMRGSRWEINAELNDFEDGKIKSTEKIREYLRQYQPVIELIRQAVKIKNCQWVLDVSRGYDQPMDELISTSRMVCFVLTEDARLQLEQGNIKQASQRCRMLYKMSRHINSCNWMITSLIQYAFCAKSRQVIRDFLPDCNYEILADIRNYVTDAIINKASAATALRFEAGFTLQKIRKDSLYGYIKSFADSDMKIPDKLLGKCINADEDFIKACRGYYRKTMVEIARTAHMPYLQAYERLQAIHKNVQADTALKDEAKITDFLTYDYHFGHHRYNLRLIELGSFTAQNALLTAVYIYMHKIQKGSLPGTLPDNIPAEFTKDLYSGKDFEYRKTKQGFMLRCRGKDLRRNRLREYKFVIK